MSARLHWDEDREIVHATVERFCAERCDATWIRTNAGAFDRERWKELAALGVWALGTPEGEGGLLEAVAASEALGAGVFPGPVVETALAVSILDDPERLTSGEQIAGIGSGSLFSFATEASCFFAISEEGVAEARPRGGVEPVATLGGETWGRVDVELDDVSAASEKALQRARLWGAGLLVGLAGQLLEAAAEHARTRRQFGRAIGEFQAISHRLAEGWMGLRSAALLVREAAAAGDHFEAEAETLAAAAWLSARRNTLAIASSAHQVFGAVGITLEGPAFASSRRIRQLASLPLRYGAAERLRQRTLTEGAGLLAAGR